MGTKRRLTGQSIAIAEGSGRSADRQQSAEVDGIRAAAILAFATNGISFVVFGTVAFSLLMSLLFLVTRGNDSLYDQIGQGGLAKEPERARGGPALGGVDSPAELAERELEVRQMLGARSERMVRRGEPPLDIDAEVARLLGAGHGAPAAHDPQLVEEVRQLVRARNERRARQGLEALDVEAEVARTLQELSL